MGLGFESELEIDRQFVEEGLRTVEKTPMLHKQYGKRQLTQRDYNEYSQVSAIFWISRMVNSKNGIVYLILFTFQESWRAPDPVLSRDRGSRLQRHP